MKKAHKPKKIDDTNIMRCILLNINEGFATEAAFYSIDEKRFQALLEALEKAGIVSEISDAVSEKNTSNYCIANRDKYNEWSKKDFYRSIRNIVIPLVTIVTEAAIQLSK